MRQAARDTFLSPVPLLTPDEDGGGPAAYAGQGRRLSRGLRPTREAAALPLLTSDALLTISEGPFLITPSDAPHNCASLH